MKPTYDRAWGSAAGTQARAAALDEPAPPDSAGLQFSAAMRRSWCARRTVNPGLLALSVLREEARRRLFEAWRDSGAPLAHVAAEVDALLDDIAGQLPDASRERAVCRLEQLTLRASDQAFSFVSPDRALLRPQRIVRRAPHAGVVLFHGAPDPLVRALMPPSAPPGAAHPVTAVLVAPGLNPVCRLASHLEHTLWARLELPAVAAALARAGSPRAVIESMLHVGALEYA